MYWFISITVTVIVSIWAVIASLVVFLEIHGISKQGADADPALDETSSATLDNETQHNSARALVPNAARMRRWSDWPPAN